MSVPLGDSPHANSLARALANTLAEQFIILLLMSMIMRVCGEIYDGRTDRIYDSGDFPDLAGRSY